MAYERLSDSKSRGEGLGAFIDSQLKLYSRQITARNAEDEYRFMKAVVDGDLDLEGQLEYRKEQLARVSDDKVERKRVQGEIKVLKSLVEQNKYASEYLDKLVDFEGGMSSIDSVLSWLTDQKEQSTDENVLAAIDKEILARTKDKFTITQNVIKNQTEYAIKDKGDGILTDHISQVQAKRSSALLSGNEELVSIYDLQLQALTKAKTENAIDRDIKNFAVSTITGSSTAIGLLDSYNSRISSADVKTPITVNGTTYANAREFWTYTRDSYLADSGGSGFFNRINNETSTAMKVKASNNLLSASDIATVASSYNALVARPELAPYQARLEAARQDTIQTAADSLSSRITSQYEQSLDLNKALADLNTLKAQGVNVDTATQRILSAATQLKTTNISNIVQAAQDLMANNPGMSVNDAVNKAVASGAGVVLSPSQILSTSAEGVASTVLGASKEGAVKPDETTTIKPENTAAIPTPAPLPAAPVNTPPQQGAGGTHTVLAGENLTVIAAKYGTTVQALQAENGIVDRNKIQAGATLKIPAAPTSTTTPGVVPTAPPQQQQQAMNPAAATVPPANPQPTPQAPSAASGTYTIKYGDTLDAIAAQNNTTADNLAKINGILDKNKIKAGATIKLS